MADLSDVTDALVTLIAGVIYPDGTGAASTTGTPTKIYGGWPAQATLDTDTRAGRVTVTVHPSGAVKVLSGYPREWQTQTTPAPTITTLVSGLTVTFGGTVTVGNYATLTVKGKFYAYAALAGDTLATIATALATLINADTPATASGAVITIDPTADGRIAARVSAPATLVRELRRQLNGYQVTIWAQTPAMRVAAARLIDPALTLADRITVPDGTATRLLYGGSSLDRDGGEANGLYRRDILFMVEFATTDEMAGYPINAAPVTVSALPPTMTDIANA